MLHWREAVPCTVLQHKLVLSTYHSLGLPHALYTALNLDIALPSHPTPSIAIYMYSAKPLLCPASTIPTSRSACSGYVKNVLPFYIYLYTKNHHHPYIDSTTVLSDNTQPDPLTTPLPSPPLPSPLYVYTTTISLPLSATVALPSTVYPTPRSIHVSPVHCSTCLQ